MLDSQTYTATLRTRKRCPHCGKMVEVGTRAVMRACRIRTHGSLMKSHTNTYAYHTDCAAVAPELQPNAHLPAPYVPNDSDRELMADIARMKAEKAAAEQAK